MKKYSERNSKMKITGKNTNWPEADQLATYKQNHWPVALAGSEPGTTELKSSALNHSAMLPPRILGKHYVNLHAIKTLRNVNKVLPSNSIVVPRVPTTTRPRRRRSTSLVSFSLIGNSLHYNSFIFQAQKLITEL